MSWVRAPYRPTFFGTWDHFKFKNFIFSQKTSVVDSHYWWTLCYPKIIVQVFSFSRIDKLKVQYLIMAHIWILIWICIRNIRFSLMPPVSKHRPLVPLGFEPRTSRVWGERDSHYTTKPSYHVKCSSFYNQESLLKRSWKIMKIRFKMNQFSCQLFHFAISNMVHKDNPNTYSSSLNLTSIKRITFIHMPCHFLLVVKIYIFRALGV